MTRGFRRMQHQVAHPEIAMHTSDTSSPPGRFAGNHAMSASIAGIGSVFAASNCRGPTINLPPDIVLRLAVIFQTDLVEINTMQGGEHLVHRIIDRGPLGPV